MAIIHGVDYDPIKYDVYTGEPMSTPGLGASEYHGFDLAEHRAKIHEIAATNEERVNNYYRSTKFITVCICGSMKFYPWMLKVAQRETLLSNIVLMPFVLKSADMTQAELDEQHLIEQALPSGVNLPIMLDAMHRRKIDLADEVIICTNSAAYIGESTQGEIQYAARSLKPIRFAIDRSSDDRQ